MKKYITYIFLFLAGWLIAMDILAFSAEKTAKELISGGCSVTGVVVTEQSGIVNSKVIKYTVDGKEYALAVGTDLEVGNEVTVYYNKENPAESVYEDALENVGLSKWLFSGSAVVCLLFVIISYIRGRVPAGLRDPVYCSVCGTKIYQLDHPTTDQKLALMKKGYDWESLYQCTSCGQYTCEHCMRPLPICRCGRGSNLIVTSAARKSKFR